MVSLESLSGVAEKVSQDEMMLKMGDEATHAGVHREPARRVARKRSREFEVTYPEDYDRKTLAGRTVRFKATVKAVRRKELPEVNDEFAKDLGDYQTVFELKEAVRKSLTHEREHKAQDEAKHQLIDKLVDAHDFPVPEVYIDRQVEINVENQLRTLAAQGIDPRGIKLDWQKVRETQKDKAARDVKASLLLDKIAEREAIGATQEEIDREVQKIARQQREAGRHGPREAPKRRRHRPDRRPHPHRKNPQLPVRASPQRSGETRASSRQRRARIGPFMLQL